VERKNDPPRQQTPTRPKQGGTMMIWQFFMLAGTILLGQFFVTFEGTRYYVFFVGVGYLVFSFIIGHMSRGRL
jgi:hypothetical protein